MRTEAQREEERREREKRTGRSKLILTKGKYKGRRKEAREKSGVTWAEREERRTVMRSQMLLISCVAVRVLP